MKFDWSEYFNLANALISQKALFTSEEACFRAAISRSYYSAFCLARNRARDMDKLPLKGTGEDHLIVQVHYQKSSDTARKKIGTWLDRLRDYRSQADYDDDILAINNVWVISKNHAQNIIDALSKL